MGKVEKLVVLGVLLVISVILAVSLNQSGDPAAGRRAGPSERAPTQQDLLAASSAPSASRSEERRLPAPSPETAAPSPRQTGARPAPTEPPATAAPMEETPRVLTSSVRPVVPEDWDLMTLEGLDEPGAREDAFKVYTCAPGDTFALLAVRFYGDEGRAELLRRNNEGVSVLVPGQTILVPVRDDAGPTAREHVVADGESLWIISREFYGKGSRWAEIYEANRDVLASPDAVRAGMVLRIP